MKLKREIFTIFVVVIVSASLNAENFPNLNALTIGSPFPQKYDKTFSDTDRPTTQFNVPNYGKSSNVFPEYEVVILNSTNEVVVAAARAAMSTHEMCKENKAQIKSFAEKRFDNYVLAKEGEVEIEGPSAYINEDENTYYTLDCYRSRGPFWTLEYQLRGKNEDSELKNAWNNFFKNR